MASTVLSSVIPGTSISSGTAFGFVARNGALGPLDSHPAELPPEELERQLGRLDNAIRRVRATPVELVTEEHGPAEADRDEIIATHLPRHAEELKRQLSAILSAADGHRVGVLLPMITSAADVVEARALLEATRTELVARGGSLNGETRLGAMIDVPLAALTQGEILPLVDFVSVGTNDLLQYLTASDRNNEEVLRHQVPAASGLGTLLELVMVAAGSCGRDEDVAVCGEMASQPEEARFLVQLGIRSLSVLPAAASAIRRALCENTRSLA